MEIYSVRFLDAIKAEVTEVWEKRGGAHPWPNLEARYRQILVLMAEHYRDHKEFELPINEDLIRECLYFYKYNNEMKWTIIYDFVSNLYGDFVQGYETYVRDQQVLSLMLRRFTGVEAVLRHVYSFIPPFLKFLH